MRSPLGVFIFISMMLLLDIYMYQAVKTVSQSASARSKTIISYVYWGVTLLTIGGFLLFALSNPDFMPKKVRTYLFATVAGLFIGKLIAAVFFLVDDLRRFIQWIGITLFAQNNGGLTAGTGNISRSAFLSWLGITAGTGLFGSLLYGFSNKYAYNVNKVQLNFGNLPEAFRGLRMVHISDIHSGSFTDKKSVIKGVQKILEQQPDIIVFTGDLVNNLAEEMNDYSDVFGGLKAPLGVYSILGNHDYADYVRWDSTSAKAANLERLKAVHAGMGWRLLLDENIPIEKNGHRINLIGVQNISGKSNFHSYGDMGKAYNGVSHDHFNILLSHDPSHWDSEVKKKYPGVDLMLSGHTHGMQFGLELPGFKWSPVQYIYRQWAGLYEDGSQKLYVNRGFGFIGYPGRLGILPEITVLEFV